MLSWLLAAALMFPNVHARDLDGRAIETDSLRGNPAVFLLGFTYESRHAVEKWAQVIAGLPRAPRTIQMPIYGGMAALARPWIDRSMARNTPREAHRDVLTTTDRDVLVRGLKLDDPDGSAATVLVNARGEVALIERGNPTDAARKRFAATWKGLLGSQ